MIITNVLGFLGGMGTGEMILIFAVVVLLFGAKKLPELAKGLGKGIKEFKDATKDVRENIEDGLKDTGPIK